MIYIIDDDRNIVESLTMVLEANGYQTKSQFNQENVVDNLNKYNSRLKKLYESNKKRIDAVTKAKVYYIKY